MDKQCRVCAVTKPLSEFPVHRTGKDGHKNLCKECMRDDEFRRKRTPRGMTYTRYRCMLNRVYGNASKDQKYYRDKGIVVCDRWLQSFENFLEDMGFPPSIEYQLDRIENSLGYFKENCRWATKSQQSRNRSITRIIINGESKLLIEWAEISGISLTTLRNRFYRGWDMSKILHREEQADVVA